YGAGGTNGGSIRHLDRPGARPVDLSRKDFRFDPVSEAFQAISGGERFGNTFDDWDNRFICNIRNPVIHVVLPNHYLARNPFLPVNFVNAPDGTLHVLDMYRETIEHPWSIPDDIHDRLDLLSGRDRGRIYRLAPPGFKTSPPPRLGQASTAELVAALENPN